MAWNLWHFGVSSNEYFPIFVYVCVCLSMWKWIHCLDLCLWFIRDPINSIKDVVFIDYKHLLCVVKSTNGFTSSPSTYLDEFECEHQYPPSKWVCVYVSVFVMMWMLWWVWNFVWVHECPEKYMWQKWCDDTAHLSLRYHIGASVSSTQWNNNNNNNNKEWQNTECEPLNIK